MRSPILFLAAALASLALASCSSHSSAPPVNTNGTGLDGQLVQGSGQKVATAVGDGLGGIEVQLINPSNGQVSGSTTTTADGKFSFRQLPNGQVLLKIRFRSTADLDGDGVLDFIESFIPVTLSADQIAQLTAALNFDDTDGDNANDALKIDIRIRVGNGGGEQHFIRTHRHRSGDTEVDEDGNGTVDDDFNDDDNDGLPDDDNNGGGGNGGSQGGVHSSVWRGAISALTGTSLTVGGKTFTLNDATTFRLRGNHDAAATDFAVGDIVKVKGLTNSDGTFTALEVSLKWDQSAHPGAMARAAMTTTITSSRSPARSAR